MTGVRVLCCRYLLPVASQLCFSLWVPRSHRSNDDKCCRLFAWFTTIHRAKLPLSTSCCQYKRNIIAVQWRMFLKYFCLVYLLTTNIINCVRNSRKLSYVLQIWLTEWQRCILPDNQQLNFYQSLTRSSQPSCVQCQSGLATVWDCITMVSSSVMSALTSNRDPD